MLKNCSDDIYQNENVKTPSQNQWLTHFETLHAKLFVLAKNQEETLNYEKIKDKFIELDAKIEDSRS